MSIIGIITSQKQTNQIKKEIEEETDELKLEIICINYKSIENIKNIKFDIVIIQDSPEKLKENKKYLKGIVKNAKCLLLNTDLKIDEEVFKDIKVKILTYGLKQKSTITASSIGADKITISIQRAFKDLKGSIIELQEIPEKLERNNTSEIYNSLIKISIINMCGLKNA